MDRWEMVTHESEKGHESETERALARLVCRVEQLERKAAEAQATLARFAAVLPTGVGLCCDV